MPQHKRTPQQVVDRLVPQDDGCWVWPESQAVVAEYQRVTISGVTRPAHRVVYEHLVGPIPDGLYLDHLCRNKRCANPEHLEPVTNQENQRRGIHGMKVACPQGHPYDETNTYVYQGRRSCRKCHAIRQAPRNAAIREQKAK